MKNNLLLIFLFLSSSLCAQSVLEKKMDGTEKGKTLSVILDELERLYPVRFYYLPEWIENVSIEESHQGQSVRDVLNDLLLEVNLSVIVWDEHSIVFVKDPTQAIKNRTIINSAVREQKKVDRVTVGVPSGLRKAGNVVLKGRITDGKTKLPLPGASIAFVNTGSGVQTGIHGDFEIAIQAGQHVLQLAHVGYDEKIIALDIYNSGELNFELDELPRMLDEVVVSDVGGKEISTTRIGQTQLSIKEIKRAPSFLGMSDIIKQVQTQTGVSTVSEASSGFNVRGGGVDQNLILFDGVPVFNTSHALGFFTAFNSESIGQATFYKGGIPAEFGGRVSSVLDMSSKEGDYQRWKGIGGLGFVASEMSVGGPIKKDTSSLIVSLRSSYSDWILNLLKTRYKDIQQGSVFFYDASVKYTHKLDKNSKLVFSGYTSSDRFKLANDTTNQWQNITSSIRYDHVTNKNFYYNVGLYFGRYSYRVSERDPVSAFTLDYRITYPSLKVDFTHEAGLHKQLFGFHTTYYNFSPGTLKPSSSESKIATKTMPNESSLETAVYFSDAFRWQERFSVDVGLRLSLFTRIGSGTVYQYRAGAPLEVRNTERTIHYGAWNIMKTYFGPEPRLSVQYTLDRQSSLKFGYHHMYQYVHLVSNTASVTPVDIWQSSNTYFKPQQADQVSIGYFRNTKENTFEFSLETFYKAIKNVLDFKDGASLILNPQLETALLRGTAKSYGVEALINKLTGRLIGGVNYTYSRSLRKVNGQFDTEKINKGDWYPSNYDQPNILNVNWRYSLARKIFFTGFFTYHTGRPVSLPVGTYTLNNVPITDFSERNNYRIPNYHRLDLALIIEGNNRKKKNWESSWALSIYNVYGRKNPYSVYFADQGGGVLMPYQLSLIGTPVPSVTYRFKF